MEVITTHTNADFDALASIIGAKKLYPDAKLILSGGCEKNVKEFLAREGIPYQFEKPRKGLFDNVRTLIVVDTQFGDRIGNFQKLLGKKSLKLHLFDHHPPHIEELRGELNLIEEKGATITLILKILREKNIAISPQEATLFALGIYEDTGFLTFKTTTPQDFEACSFLLSQGAELGKIHYYLQKEFSLKHFTLLQELIEKQKKYSFGTTKVSIVHITREKYQGDFAIVTQRLCDIQRDIGAVFTIVEFRDKVYVIARSKTKAINVDVILSEFNGGGHPTAASTSLKGIKAEEVIRRIIEILRACPLSQLREKAVKFEDFFLSSIPLREAREKVKKMSPGTRLPVIKGKKLIGIVTREEILKLRRPHFLNQPLELFIKSPRLVLPGNTLLTEVAPLVKETSASEIVVLNRGRPEGYIPTEEIKKELQETETRKGVIPDLTPILKGRLPSEIMKCLVNIGKAGDEFGVPVFIVGGFVRDLLLGIKNYDLDIVVEGDGIAFGRFLAKKTGGFFKAFSKFKTGFVILPRGEKVDIATARSESYPSPGALPEVEASLIKYDLKRRDFTINSMAIRLNQDKFGLLYDFFQGQRDLKHRVIKVLHSLSFIDDPTRMLRAIRFEKRYQFKMDRFTECLLRNAAKVDALKSISVERFRNELFLILKEPTPRAPLKRMAEFDLLKYLHPRLTLPPQVEEYFREAEKVLTWYQLSFSNKKKFRVWLFHLLLLLEPLTSDERAEVAQGLKLSQRDMELLSRGKEEVAELTRALSKRRIRNSTIFSLLENMAPEVLLYTMSKSKNLRVRENIQLFLTFLSKIQLHLTGDDLVQAGFPEGPEIGKVLERTRAAVLDGKLRTKKEELKYALKFKIN
jgi:tRNA nucleotidyltransferase (CCA-adding enzyme)